MAKIRFQDGTEIEVQGTPSPQEVERLYAQAQQGRGKAEVGGKNIPILSGLAKIGTGFASEVSKIPFGLAQLGARAVGARGAAQTIGEAREAIFEKPFEQDILNTGAGKVGQVGGVLGSFVAPSGAITKGQRLLTGAASRLTRGAPRVVQGAARLGSRAAVEGASDFGVELARTGGDFEQAQKAGVGGAAFSGVLGGLGAAYRQAFSPNLQRSAVRALGLTGKQTAGSAETAGVRFAQGLETLAERGKGVKVLDDTGIEKAFEPTKASFPETLQAFNKTKSNIYSEYSKLAQKTGDDLIDVSDVWVQLDELAKRPNLGQTRNAIRQLMDDMDVNFPSGYGTASDLQSFLQELNKVSVSQFAGTGDRALGRVAISVGDILRERLDDVISTATGGQYAELRQAYGSLKSIESELVNQFKKQSRRLGGGLQDYMQIVNSGDLVGALITADPKVLAASGVRAFLTQLRTSLNDPERYLRRAFNLIENDKPSRVLRERVFGGNLESTPEFQRGFRGADETMNLARTQGEAGFIDPTGRGIAQVFEGYPDLTTKVLNELEGKRTVSTQFISDLTNKPQLKQAERNLIREVLDDFPEGKVNVQEFADKVKARLLPLEANTTKLQTKFDPNSREAVLDTLNRRTPKYESVSLPNELRGQVSQYYENVYESPIKNSAGDAHFRVEDVPNYFAHTRIEDMADGKTRRVIEAQSDLFQKGRLETSIDDITDSITREEINTINKKYPDHFRDADQGRARSREINSLRESKFNSIQPYRNTWWERITREEVRKAAQDGKTKLQFPTGETAMKIEGLGDTSSFNLVSRRANEPDFRFFVGERLTKETIKVGQEVQGQGGNWIITEVLGDGKFKAVPGRRVFNAEDIEEPLVQQIKKQGDLAKLPDGRTYNATQVEQFDISGKVDTSNPIYRFYEKDMQKYLQKNYNAKTVTDENGVTWVEVNLKPSMANVPVEAFGVLPFISSEALSGDGE